ncbi:MAG: ABC-2 transporter permease [Oscillospiraceae bacterium]|nr:ABC-2 transporter permease [Oscillospiraceae bacterium]
MRSLLLLDGYTVIRQLKFFLFFILFYFAFALATPNAIFLGFSTLFLMMMPYYLMQYTESYRSDALFLILPGSRKTIVQERYLSVLIALVPVLLLSLLSGLIHSWDYCLVALAEATTAVLVLAVLLPLAYRFGNTKMRLILTVFIGVMIGVSSGAGNLLEEGDLTPLSLPLFPLLAFVALLLSLLILLVSYRISLKIYAGKEF